MRIQLALVLTVLTGASTAHALNQSKHFDVTLASCASAGLPDAFCERVATEVYNVDAHEFNDLSAHSQIPDGSTACDAANTSLWRVFWLGGQVRAALANVAAHASVAANDAIAQNLGRALHTVQDNCAHSGMPNPQHAWHSLSDVCRGTVESPDVNPAAFACASNETDAIFSAFVDVVNDQHTRFADLTRITTDNDTHWPAYSDVCDFLGSAGDWNGQDRRWDNAVVRPALTDRLVRALYGADASQFARVCTGADNGVVAAYSDADHDTSGGAQSCIKIHTFCLGKADAAADAEPPPYEPMPAAPVSSAATTTNGQVTGGCSAGGSGSPDAAAPLAFVLVAAALLFSRRRRARA
jgi:uncharacterized protein (TIGR03382 family)